MGVAKFQSYIHGRTKAIGTSAADVWSITTTAPDTKATASLPQQHLVIDALAWLYTMIYNPDLQVRYGAQYLQLNNRIEKELQIWAHHNVCLHFVFDGVRPGGKLKTTIARRSQRLKEIETANHKCKPIVILPLLAVQCCMEIFRNRGIDFVVAPLDIDADKYCMYLSNKYDCPILAKDTDFYFMDLKKGFIDLSTIIVGKEAISGQMYSRSKLSKCLKLLYDLLPALAVIIGNDFTSEILTSTLHRVLKIERNDPIQSAIEHLRLFDSLESLVTSLKSSLSSKLFAEFIAELKYYDKFEDNFEFTSTDCIEAALMEGKFPEEMLSQQNIVIMPSIFEIFSYENCWSATLEIRINMYSLFYNSHDILESNRVDRRLKLHKLNKDYDFATMAENSLLEASRFIGLSINTHQERIFETLTCKEWFILSALYLIIQQKVLQIQPMDVDAFMYYFQGNKSVESSRYNKPVDGDNITKVGNRISHLCAVWEVILKTLVQVSQLFKISLSFLPGILDDGGNLAHMLCHPKDMKKNHEFFTSVNGLCDRLDIKKTLNVVKEKDFVVVKPGKKKSVSDGARSSGSKKLQSNNSKTTNSKNTSTSATSLTKITNRFQLLNDDEIMDMDE